MVILSSKDYDIDGTEVFYQIDSDSDIFEVNRRLSRTKTLGGGVEIYDAGHSQSDREFIITVSNVEKRNADNIQRLVRSYPLLILSVPDGVFTVAPETFRYNEGKAYLRLLSKELISR